MFHCFDDKGQFTLGSIVWILFKIGIFKPERSESEIDVNALFPPLDEIRLSVSRENLLARRSVFCPFFFFPAIELFLFRAAESRSRMRRLKTS